MPEHRCSHALALLCPQSRLQLPGIPPAPWGAGTGWPRPLDVVGTWGWGKPRAVLSALAPEGGSAAPLPLSTTFLSLRRPKSDLAPASDKYQSQIQGHHRESDVLHQVAKDT